MSPARVRVGVLASGSGSNLQALLDAAQAPSFPAEIAVVVCNVPGARALERAATAHVATEVVPHGDFPGRAEFDAALLAALQRHRVELVCLAGFMRLIGPTLLQAFSQRVLNIHPALLPAFPGLHGPRQALAHGVKLAGCTVHLVDQGTDTGPILLQAAVPVLGSDTEETLAARILVQEHRIYPQALALLAAGRLTLTGRTVHLERGLDPQDASALSLVGGGGG